jgi:hypothetical protein
VKVKTELTINDPSNAIFVSYRREQDAPPILSRPHNSEVIAVDNASTARALA